MVESAGTPATIEPLATCHTQAMPLSSPATAKASSGPKKAAPLRKVAWLACPPRLPASQSARPSAAEAPGAPQS